MGPVSYARLGQAPPPSIVGASALPDDVAPSAVAEMARPIERRRGWVAIPTYDLREYTKAQMLTAAAGFVVGMTVGAILGNVLSGQRLETAIRSVVRNPGRRRRRRKHLLSNAKRRTSDRKRPRGRPSIHPVTDQLSSRVAGHTYEVSIEHGSVTADGRPRGAIYDFGTSFRAIPNTGGKPRTFTALGKAVQYLIRESENLASTRSA